MKWGDPSRWSGDPLWPPCGHEQLALAKSNSITKSSKWRKVLAWLIPPSPPSLPCLFFLWGGHWECRSETWRKESQVAISVGAGDGWTSAKWRIMIMFVLIINSSRINLYVNREEVFSPTHMLFGRATQRGQRGRSGSQAISLYFFKHLFWMDMWFFCACAKCETKCKCFALQHSSGSVYMYAWAMRMHKAITR